MEKKDKLELIDAIKQGLRSLEEVPYRAGAWEDFRAHHPMTAPASRKTHSAYYLGAAAAATLLLAFGMLYRIGLHSGPEKANPEQDILTDRPELPSGKPSVGPDVDEPAVFAENSPKSLPQTDNPVDWDRPLESGSVRKPFVPERETAVAVLSSALSMDGKVASDRLSAGFDPVRSRTGLPLSALRFASLASRGEGSMTHKSVPNTVGFSASPPPFSPAEARLTDRLEIGVFLSPGTTGENFDMGGGLLLGYRLGDRLSLRTGASFNQYEVGVLAMADKARKDGPQDSPVQGADRMLEANTPYRANSVLRPNLNAVSGKVQTMDVPVELKYWIDAGFYAAAGMSYAAVLSQERYNHYRESPDPLTYSSSSDSDRPVRKNQTAVETVLKSAEENVRSNGFGGFVNLSLGRRTSLSKNLKLSVEPYVKIPIGRFRRADMNYTNGGVKIIVITNPNR